MGQHSPRTCSAPCLFVGGAIRLVLQAPPWQSLVCSRQEPRDLLLGSLQSLLLLGALCPSVFSEAALGSMPRRNPTG